MGHDCDLALLSVEDELFWSAPTAMLPLELGPVPELQQGVVVVGYPTGGDNTSVTSGGLTAALSVYWLQHGR